MKKATIYDVAREAGVSLATVSRVINGSSVVREKTKEKVMKVIDELNFKLLEVLRQTKLQLLQLSSHNHYLLM